MQDRDNKEKSTGSEVFKFPPHKYNISHNINRIAIEKRGVNIKFSHPQ